MSEKAPRWNSRETIGSRHKMPSFNMIFDKLWTGLYGVWNHWKRIGGEINFWKTPAGETIALDRACLDGISGIVNGLNLIGPSTKVTLEFQQRYTGTASCQAVYDGNAIAGIPIEWTYSRGTLPRKVELTTGEDGWSEVRLEGFESGLLRSELKATIPLDELIPSLQKSKAAKLIGSLINPDQTWTIELPPPTVYIQTNESVAGKRSDQTRLRDGLAQGVK